MCDVGNRRSGRTPAFFLESPTNPTLEVIDIAAVAALAEAAGARLVVDDVFATPLQQRPLELGAHVVVYSATKHIDGQAAASAASSSPTRSGSTTKPARLFPAHRPQPVAVQCLDAAEGAGDPAGQGPAADAESAGVVADMLAGRPEVASVIYPGRPDHPQAELARRQMSGGSTLVCFTLKGGKSAAFAFQNALEIVGFPTIWATPRA